MKDFLERLLDYYKITKEDYMELIKPVSSLDFDAGHEFDNIDEIKDFIMSFVKNNKKIIVYGDYDADGMMATSIMVKMFRYINYDVDYYIPNRYVDAYGINLNKAQEIIDKGYDLVITVDNGISAFEPIKLLKNNGVSVIVFDHHELQESLPVCDYYLHPTISHFGEIASSAAFVCFMFSKKFLNRYDKYLATLASISLISDMMPLKEYNRNLLRVVIDDFKKGEFAAIDLLLEGEEFSESSIGMKIAPKINSIGRLVDDESLNDVVSFFINDNKEELLHYIDWINSVNDERKNLSTSAINENLELDETKSCYCIKVEEKEGVIGLIANHITLKHKKPAIVFVKTKDDGVLKSSIRVPEGYNVIKIFNHLNKYLLSFGGHALAGGCSIKESDFDAFRDEFENYISSNPVEVVQKEYIPLLIRELNFDNFKIVKSFSPFGEAMKAPKFILPRIRSAALTFSKSQEHIMTQVGTNVRLIGFNMPKRDINPNTYYDLIGTMRKSEFRGFVNLEFLIEKLEESK